MAKDAATDTVRRGGAEGFRRSVRDWIRANAPAPGGPYEQWERRLLAARLICPAWPREYGGSALGPLDALTLAEECARAGAPLVQRGVGEHLIGPAVMEHGTPAQRSALLPGIVSGEDRYCLGFSEPDHGSDLASAATAGEVRGGEVVVTGLKAWVAEPHRANMIAVLCRTSPASPAHRGLSLVLVPLTPANGVRVCRIRELTGSYGLGEVRLDGARVPLSHAIGGVDGGWAPAMTALAHGRAHEAASAHLGFEERFWELVREARKSGRAREPEVRAQLAWAYTRITLLRATGLRIAARTAAGADTSGEAAVAALFRSEFGRRFGEIAVGVSGAAELVRPEGDGYGLSEWQEAFLTGRGATIGAGTGEVRRNAVAERVLGLPKEAGGGGR
ncbi:acyl-CoA dehydrogenase family protein [Streptomyces sp. NPDC050610]|uniref:acyl-CoA dehydrogenase family protein n=1 Tax=Streptomyces sp. NPDC050610 TaxID=3157097 RepID=UPI00343BA322